MTTREDEGFSLVELVIAIMLLAVMALAVLPLAIQATALSVSNRENSAANAFASSELATVRARFPDTAVNLCDDVRSLHHGSRTDPANNALSVTMAVTGECPVTVGVLTVTATVVDDVDALGATTVMSTQIVVTTP